MQIQRAPQIDPLRAAPAGASSPATDGQFSALMQQLAAQLPAPAAAPSATGSPPAEPPSGAPTARPPAFDDAGAEVSESRKAFRDFVGQTLFGQMLQSMRSTVGKPAYFHGGQTEEIFQKQMDQVLVEEISDASAAKVADPMYDLFMQSRVQ